MEKIRIELKSDMCVSNGDTYNTMLDGDVCYDDYGLPYIPAKRIKGCLREAAEELNHISKMTGEKTFCIDTERLFGMEDSGALVLSNARLAEPVKTRKEENQKEEKYLDYQDFISDLKEAKKEGLGFHPQQIISTFTYIRKMTKIGKNGAAEDTSLRTLRVLKKGLIFEADAAIDMSAVQNNEAVCFEELKKELELCCKALRHMGLHRTRGLGEVAVSLKGLKKIHDLSKENNSNVQLESNSVKMLHYAFKLNAPVVVKNIEKGVTKTQDYLEGSKIIGVLSKRVPQEQLRRILNDPDTIFSNAYIADEDWHRYTPVPASFCEYKDSTKNIFIDRVSVTDYNRDEIKEQLSALDKFYVFRTEENSYSYMRKNVSTEIRYHHARSADKGMGSVSTDGAFYQVQSICEGQVFQGFICAKEKYLNEIEEAIRKEGNCRIGNQKSAEYGAVSLRVKREKDPVPVKTFSGMFAVRLNAPVIMYNKYGMYSTDETDFKNLLTNLIGNKPVSLECSYKKYAMTGGFNSTWKMPKPVLSVLDKGSVFIFKTETCMDIQTKPVRFIGERTMEGYGEIEFYQVLNEFSGTLSRADMDPKKKDTEEKDEEMEMNYHTSMIPLLAEMILGKHCRKCGRQLADAYYGTAGQNPQASLILNVTNQLLYSLREGDSMDTLRLHAAEYKIEAKKTTALELLDQVDGSIRELDFSKQLSEQADGFIWKPDSSLNWAAMQYRSRHKEKYALEEFWKNECLKSMLEQLKYRCTESVKKTRNGGLSNGI